MSMFRLSLLLVVAPWLVASWGLTRYVGKVYGDEDRMTVSDLKSDERVIFFPVAAHRIPNEDVWEATVRAWVFEPSDDSLRRRSLIELLKIAWVSAEGDQEKKILEERIRPFLVDNERGKKVIVRVGDKHWPLDPTESNGLSTGVIRLPDSLVAREARDGVVSFQAVLASDDQREFRGSLHLIDAEGISVISDIDDTIRDSQVLDKRELLRNSFLRPFKPVEGMSPLYRKWSEQHGARFHFVSASPWQFYEPLEEMRQSASFPRATFHLRPFRYKDSTSVFTLLDSQQHKIDAIETLLRAFPKRRFILVGDTGEKDPEVYGELYRRHSSRIVKIYLRNVSKDERESARYSQALAEAPSEAWELFTDPSQVTWPIASPK
ncbi:MAG: App1 family protein [Pirellulales bacterium]